MSEHIHDSLPTILHEWTLEQALDAHEALDYIQALQDEALSDASKDRIR